MSKKVYWIFGIAVAVIVVVLVLSSSITDSKIPGKLDAFASCLKDKGATFYGAF